MERVGEGSLGSRLGVNGGTLPVRIQGTDILLGGDVILSVNDIDVTVPAAIESAGLTKNDNYDRVSIASAP